MDTNLCVNLQHETTVTNSINKSHYNKKPFVVFEKCFISLFATLFRSVLQKVVDFMQRFKHAA